jgi:hypothetical protein
MNRVVEIIEANHVFILIIFIVVTFYLLWTTNSKLKQLSKQLTDLKIKVGSLEKKQNRNTIDKYSEQQVFDKIDKKEEPIPVKVISRQVEDEILSYFKLAENWYGQNRQIIVRFNRGAHRGEMYSYNHDDVYDNTINYYSELPCWIKDGYYSNGRNIPGNVLPYVTKIKE